MEPQRRPPVWEEEALIPELVDRLEYQDAELARLRADLETLRDEREKLETDLVIAERWVHTAGCRRWFNVVRDTVTDRIDAVYRMGEWP